MLATGSTHQKTQLGSGLLHSGAGSGKHDHANEGDAPVGRNGSDPVRTAMRHTVARQLPYFVAVADHGNFHRAAEQLNITQSALTRRIQNLEAALQTTLFERKPSGVTMTEAGSVLYEEAGRLMSQIDWVVGQVAEISSGEKGRLQVALNDSASRNPIVTGALLQYRNEHPGVDLHLSVMPNDDIIAALEADLIDAGFFYHAEGDDRVASCGAIFIEDINVVLAVASDHRLATQERVTASDLEEEPLVWPSRGRGRFFHNRLMGLMKRSDFIPRSTINVISTETAMNLVAARLALSLVPENYPVPPNVVLRPLADVREIWPLKMMWRNNNQRGTLKALQEVVRELAEAGSAR